MKPTVPKNPRRSELANLAIHSIRAPSCTRPWSKGRCFSRSKDQTKIQDQIQLARASCSCSSALHTCFTRCFTPDVSGTLEGQVFLISCVCLIVVSVALFVCLSFSLSGSNTAVHRTRCCPRLGIARHTSPKSGQRWNRGCAGIASARSLRSTKWSRPNSRSGSPTYELASPTESRRTVRVPLGASLGCGSCSRCPRSWHDQYSEQQPASPRPGRVWIAGRRCNGARLLIHYEFEKVDGVVDPPSNHGSHLVENRFVDEDGHPLQSHAIHVTNDSRRLFHSPIRLRTEFEFERCPRAFHSRNIPNTNQFKSWSPS